MFKEDEGLLISCDLFVVYGVSAWGERYRAKVSSGLLHRPTVLRVFHTNADRRCNTYGKRTGKHTFTPTHLHAHLHICTYARRYGYSEGPQSEADCFASIETTYLYLTKTMNVSLCVYAFMSPHFTVTHPGYVLTHSQPSTPTHISIHIYICIHIYM